MGEDKVHWRRYHISRNLKSAYILYVLNMLKIKANARYNIMVKNAKIKTNKKNNKKIINGKIKLPFCEK